MLCSKAGSFLGASECLFVQPSAEVEVLRDKNWTKDEDLENARVNLREQVMHFQTSLCSVE